MGGGGGRGREGHLAGDAGGDENYCITKIYHAIMR